MFRPEFPPFSSCFKLNLASKQRILVQRKNAEQHRKTQKENVGKRSENEVCIAARSFFAVSTQLKHCMLSTGLTSYRLNYFPGLSKKERESPITFFIRKKTEKNKKKAKKNKRKQKKTKINRKKQKWKNQSTFPFAAPASGERKAPQKTFANNSRAERISQRGRSNRKEKK